MITIKEQVSLLPYNTFGINARARRLIEYDHSDDLQEVLSKHITPGEPLLVIGEGSNLLFLSDFQGTILRSRYKYISVSAEEGDNVFIEVGSGVVWDDFVVFCVENGFYGAENLSLIPGQTGAAAVQNIGAYGAEAKDIVHQVRAVEIPTGQARDFSNAECHYGYRDSLFKNECKGRFIVTSVIFRLSRRPQYNFNYQHLESAVRNKGDISLLSVRNTIIEMRESKLPDPKRTGNAGSFFKNPVIGKAQFTALAKEYPDISHFHVSETEEKISAAWLIDRCGWKGRHLGRAGVHDKQPLVLVNLGDATGSDISRLAQQIQTDVKSRFGIELHPEVNYIG